MKAAARFGGHRLQREPLPERHARRPAVAWVVLRTTKAGFARRAADKIGGATEGQKGTDDKIVGAT